jgi:type I restriction enzyme S subunit
MSFGENVVELVERSNEPTLSSACHWTRVPLGEVASILNGFPWKSEYFGTDKGVPLIRIRDVTTGKTETRYSGPVDEGFWINAGDLIIGMDGDFNLRRWAAEPGLLNQRVCKVSPDENSYSSRFLEYVLPSYLKLINASTSSVTVKHLSSRTLAEIPLPLPPLAEQRRIVKKLDALTARITRARAELERVPVLATMLRHQALRMAFRGSLTHSWEGRGNYPPVAPRPPSEIRSKFHVSSTAEEAHPFPIPETWRWYRLPQIGDLDRGKSRHRPRNDKRLFGGEHPFIQTGDVRAAGQYLKTYTETYSDFGLSQSRKWPCGTVCITIAANIAETTILGIQACFPDSVVGFTPDAERGMPEYFEYFIRTAKADLNQFAPATAQKNINLDTLGAIAVPIPPLEEQREVVCRLGEIFVRVGHLEAEAARAKALLDRLESAILAQAFKGELVPQDPEDEPAEALLARIRAQRAAAPAKRGRRVKEVV